MFETLKRQNFIQCTRITRVIATEKFQQKEKKEQSQNNKQNLVWKIKIKNTIHITIYREIRDKTDA